MERSDIQDRPPRAALDAGYRIFAVNTSFYVPHDIEAPIAGSVSGPLAGLTAAVKDLYDVAGTRTGGGSPEWLAAQQPALAHAAAVAKILAAGATVTGKTACDEFFYSGSGINAHYGAPTNVRAGAHPGRVVERIGSRGRGQCVRFRARQRHRRLGTHAGVLLRRVRAAADPRPHRSRRSHGDGAVV
jgi:Amidase